MGVVQRHEYREVFLRSEFWSDMRTRVLAKYGSRCYCCKRRRVSFDIHHLWYPRNRYAVTVHDLRPLCRECHDAAHVYTFPKRYRHATVGRRQFYRFMQVRRGITPGKTRKKKLTPGQAILKELLVVWALALKISGNRQPGKPRR